jgi:hypothetical protein
VAGKYERIWVFTNNYPHVIEMARMAIDCRQLLLAGVKELKVMNMSREEEIQMRSKAARSPEPTLIVSQVNSRHNSVFW